MQSINNQEKDPIKSEQAFNEFFFRYKSYLFKICQKVCSSFDSSNLLADDIFQNTLLKVASKAHTFKLQNPQENTVISNQVKAWLSRIAKNELIDFLRKNPDEKVLSKQFRIKSYKPEETLIDNSEVESENFDRKDDPSIQKDLLDKGLEKLSYKEKYILMTYMQYFDPEQPMRHLPDEILSGICVKFNINSENARQIKGRAMKKLKLEIDRHSKDEINVITT